MRTCSSSHCTFTDRPNSLLTGSQLRAVFSSAPRQRMWCCGLGISKSQGHGACSQASNTKVLPIPSSNCIGLGLLVLFDQLSLSNTTITIATAIGVLLDRVGYYAMASVSNPAVVAAVFCAASRRIRAGPQ